MAGDSSGLMPVSLRYGLIFVSVEISANKSSLTLDNVIIDTGSAGSIFSADRMLELGLFCTVDDELFIVSGVGGEEYVFSKKIDQITLGHLALTNFKIEIGAMDYGFEFDGILGMNFLLETKAKIDCERLVIY